MQANPSFVPVVLTVPGGDAAAAPPAIVIRQDAATIAGPPTRETPLVGVAPITCASIAAELFRRLGWIDGDGA